MQKFKVEITTPDSLVYSGDVEMAVICGEEGEFGILANHSPLITTLQSGFINAYNDNQIVDRIFVSSGFAEVKDNICSILATSAYDLAKVDKDKIKKSLELAKVDFNIASSDFDKKIAQEKIEINQAILSKLK